MWKHFIRGIRDKAGERAVTAFLETNLTVLNKVEQEGEKNEEGATNDSQHEGKKCPHVNVQRAIEVFGLGTALWFGGIVSHPLCWRNHRHDITCSEIPKPVFLCHYKSFLLPLLFGTANAQPLTEQPLESNLYKVNETVRNILPAVTVNRYQEDNKEKVEEREAVEEIDVLPDLDSLPDQILEDALQNFQKTVADIDNQLGVICSQQGKHSEALHFFELSQRQGNVKACYNLALCYELGLGTTVDDALAVKYYKTASQLGHANAMFNLALYYAQGRGGLPIDPEESRRLIHNAAKHGVPEAKEALDLEEELLSSSFEALGQIQDTAPRSGSVSTMFTSTLL